MLSEEGKYWLKYMFQPKPDTLDIIAALRTGKMPLDKAIEISLIAFEDINEQTKITANNIRANMPEAVQCLGDILGLT